MIGESLIASVVLFFILAVGIYFAWTTFFGDGEVIDIICIILYWLLIIGFICIILGI